MKKEKCISATGELWRTVQLPEKGRITVQVGSGCATFLAYSESAILEVKAMHLPRKP